MIICQLLSFAPCWYSFCHAALLALSSAILGQSKLVLANYSGNFIGWMLVMV